MARRLIGVMVSASVVLAACSGGSSSSSASKCDFEGNGKCQPDSRRVDLAQPVFTNPTAVVNSLFPSSQLEQVVQLGRDGKADSRVEVTPLPARKTIEWNGKKIDALVTQFLSYNDRRIVEVADDYVAQADDGSVWYLGEKVSNYENGAVESDEGSWEAGKDGPGGLLMPAHPKVGDVFRPENIPGLVFEEDTVTAVDQTVDGPRGPIAGAVRIREHLRENSFEDKVNAPGYGEFQIRAGDESADVAIAVPPDASPGPLPADLQAVAAGANALFQDTQGGHWSDASTTLATTTAAWDRLKSTSPPPLLVSHMDGALGALGPAVSAEDRQRAGQVAVDARRIALDLELQYRPVPEVDLARMVLGAQQLALDAAAKDTDAVKGDVAALEQVRDRNANAFDAVKAAAVNGALLTLKSAVDKKNLTAASSVATGELAAALQR